MDSSGTSEFLRHQNEGVQYSVLETYDMDKIFSQESCISSPAKFILTKLLVVARTQIQSASNIFEPK